ncbi:hypothetical protein DPMN_176533 [Dreissena polymorpha]|uniref:Uncharacterized protein n=1 Tax=Dreissena polymorpha TaxID=45954 RepID=A0A9D4EAB5_DREPO|nr:hypothetical protein DPMN_176533 [Dreissena polymorpha]
MAELSEVSRLCTFIQDPADACCQTLKCDPSAQFGTCRDALSNCASYGTYICGAQYKDWATQNCPQYCGYCGNNTNPLAVTAAPDGTCKDNIPNCVEYDRSVCSDAMYQSWALANCRKTCNLCSSTGAGTNTGTMGGGGTGTGSGGTIMTGGSGTCQDKLTNCQEYTQAACTGLYVDWARENCARFCNLCGSGSGTSGNMTGFQTVAPGSGGFTGFSGGCIYKGNYYGAGDTWTDGCDYNCSCENGQTGFYRCTARCPTYQLPSGCVLRTIRGECCGVPDCTGGGTGTGIGSGTGTGSGTGGSMTGSQTGCAYKNTLYQQGQQWKDGCQYKCTCTDASSGQYSCAALCLTWNLPPTCHLDQPAPGKCCQTPNCPANVVLNYPPGYVPE